MAVNDATLGGVYNRFQAQYGEKPQKPREIKKTLGKDDFLKIMITQMKNQDPTNPFKAEQMATEIAQFTSVEQLQNVNQNLGKMSSQNRPLEQMAMTQMIGKIVTIDRERFPHVEGQTDSLSFKLPKDASSVRAAIIGESGDVVLEKDLGLQKAGDVTFSWDGIKTNSLPAKSGNFMFRIEAKDDQGKIIETNPQTQAKVIGVSFEGNEPVFLIGDAGHNTRVTLKNIVRVDLDIPHLDTAKSDVPKSELPMSQIKPPPVPQQKFPELTKPIAAVPEEMVAKRAEPPSQPRGPGALPLQQIQAQNKYETEKSVTEEKGFPNGLKDEPEISKGGP